MTDKNTTARADNTKQTGLIDWGALKDEYDRQQKEEREASGLSFDTEGFVDKLAGLFPTSGGSFDKTAVNFMEGILPGWKERLPNIPHSPDPSAATRLEELPDMGAIDEAVSEYGPSMLGGAGTGFLARKALSGLGFLKNKSTATKRILEGALEGTVEGGVRGPGAVEGGAVGTAAGAAVELTPRGVKAAISKLIKPQGIAKVDDMMDPPSYVDDPGVNKKLIDYLESEGIETIPLAARQHSPAVAFFMAKAAQMTSAQPYLAKQRKKILRGYKKWSERVVRNMGTNATILSNHKTGQLLKDEFNDYVSKTKQAASAKYDEILDAAAYRVMDRDKIADRLELVLLDHGFEDTNLAGFSKILQRHIKHLRSGEGEVNLGNQWKTVQTWWPKSKQWDNSDFLAKDAYFVLKDEIRNTASKYSKYYETALATADAQWKHVHKLVDDDSGKLLLMAKSENVIDDMASDITSLENARKFYNLLDPEFASRAGDEFVRKIAQRRVANILQDSIDPTTKEMTATRLSEALAKYGGRDGTIDGDYFQELFRDSPEVLDNLRNLEDTLALMDAPLQFYKGSYEHMGGGQEVQAIITLATKAGALVKMLGHTATGKRLGEQIALPPARNPFLMGDIPDLTSKGFQTTASEVKTQGQRAAIRLLGGEREDE